LSAACLNGSGSPGYAAFLHADRHHKETHTMRRRLLAVTFLTVLCFASALMAQDAVRTGEITKITAASKSLMVKTARGETEVLTTDQTVIKDGDKTLKFDDLKVGDSVKVTGVRKDAQVEAKEILKQPKA
jgi:hypothetical protein